MSMNHQRNYFAGTTAPPASWQRPAPRNGRLRSGAAPYASGPESVLNRSLAEPSVPGAAAVAVPGNVVELYPGSAAVPAASRRRRTLPGAEAGMATAEYAIATLAAVGFAGLLVFILRSDEVRGFLLTLIRTALALP